MDQPRSTSGNAEDGAGIPDDLRCKRTDGKQWRCTALSMPDKTVCEKHYIQAKKRAANSQIRAKKKQFLVSLSNHREAQTDGIQYSPEEPVVRSNTMELEDDSQRDGTPFEENWESYRKPLLSAIDLTRNRSPRSFGDNGTAVEVSEDSSDEEFVGQSCHQCRRNNRERVTWCLKCDRRGYCDSCVSTWYSDIPSEEIERACPACRGSCYCKVCIRRDNMIKVRIREMPVLNKLQYHHSVLRAVLPIIKKIHHEQCTEVELEKKLRGMEIDLVRVKLNADDLMCCNFCRIPIIDYHRHCSNCAYDLCLSCCQDLRGACLIGFKSKIENQTGNGSQAKETAMGQSSEFILNLLHKFSEWKANGDGSIPCPPKEYGGCGHQSMNLNRIFKMNWVAKLVKNAEEIVSGCKVYDDGNPPKTELNEPSLCRFSNREGSNDNFLYCPSSQVIKTEGISEFRKHWARGEPIIVNQICDNSFVSSWDPMVIWTGIQETADEKLKDESRFVKAINCVDQSEVEIELGQFIKGYSEGRTNENGLPEILKLKGWPSPSASEEFLMYQRPDFISRLPLLEYTHSRLGLLNLAAKLPHYSLQNDVGPKIYISYGTYKELDRGHSVTNLHFKMRDMVYLLVHTSEVKLKGQEKANIVKIQHANRDSELSESLGNPEHAAERRSLDSFVAEPDISVTEPNMDNEVEMKAARDEGNKMEEDQVTRSPGVVEVTESSEKLNGDSGGNKMEEDQATRSPSVVVEESGSFEPNMDNEVEMKAARDEGNKMEEDQVTRSPVVVVEVTGSSEKLNGDSGGNKMEEDQATRSPSVVVEESGSFEKLNGDSGGNKMEEDQVTRSPSVVVEESGGYDKLNGDSGVFLEMTRPGAFWDVFRIEDVPKLVEFLQVHWGDFGRLENTKTDMLLHNETVFLNEHHKGKLKEEYGVEPWSFEQHVGEAVFIPAGCPFQHRNLQSTVQLGLDFFSPESVGRAAKLAEEIRCFPNDHEAKLQVMEVGKISLYAASSAIKDVQKLVLDTKFGTEVGFQDLNLTAAVSENIEKAKHRQMFMLKST